MTFYIIVYIILEVIQTNIKGSHSGIDWFLSDHGLCLLLW